MSKQYKDAATYEAKLKKVMERFGVDSYDYNWDRYSCWVEFWYEGHPYKFEHSIENARKHDSSIKYGSDAFAQVVLTLEDIARMTERGIYKLSTWIAGIKALPTPKEIPDCFKVLGFDNVPTLQELKTRYRIISKSAHPDVGGDAAYFISVQNAYEVAKDYFNNSDSLHTEEA